MYPHMEKIFDRRGPFNLADKIIRRSDGWKMKSAMLKQDVRHTFCTVSIISHCDSLQRDVRNSP